MYGNFIDLVCIQYTEKRFSKTSRLVFGDRNAHRVLECLSEISQLYGQQVVLLQYIPCTVDMVGVWTILSKLSTSCLDAY